MTLYLRTSVSHLWEGKVDRITANHYDTQFLDLLVLFIITVEVDKLVNVKQIILSKDEFLLDLL